MVEKGKGPSDPAQWWKRRIDYRHSTIAERYRGLQKQDNIDIGNQPSNPEQRQKRRRASRHSTIVERARAFRHSTM
ncbi:hypothetical protein CHS0354_024313, partial [Potamilus streckersoni]